MSGLRARYQRVRGPLAYGGREYTPGTPQYQEPEHALTRQLRQAELAQAGTDSTGSVR